MSFPSNNLNQTAVYWANPVNDGYGGLSYDDPVDISCRWEASTKLIRTLNGEQIACMAEVQVNQDLAENELLYLGEVDDLSTAQKSNPETIATAYRILRFDKVPTIKGTLFFRKAYL